MAREYFTRFSVPILGGVFNKIPRKVSYHTFDKCKEYVSRFFADEAAALAANGAGASAAAGGEVTPFTVYGFVPIVKDKEGNEDDGGGACTISCALRKPSKASLVMTEEVSTPLRTLTYHHYQAVPLSSNPLTFKYHPLTPARTLTARCVRAKR